MGAGSRFGDGGGNAFLYKVVKRETQKIQGLVLFNIRGREQKKEGHILRNSFSAKENPDEDHKAELWP